jgi:hypothetical protein
MINSRTLGFIPLFALVVIFNHLFATPVAALKRSSSLDKYGTPGNYPFNRTGTGRAFFQGRLTNALKLVKPTTLRTLVKISWHTSHLLSLL